MDLNFDINVDLEQRQELVMTPQLQTAIELLQFSSLELQEYVAEELENNPLLEQEQESGGELEDRLANQYQTHASRSTAGEEYNYENFVSHRPGLLEYMENQLYQVLEEDDLELGRYLLGNLDSDGLLNTTVDRVSRELKVDKRRVQRVLTRIQGLDPAGVAARSLKESLLIQLDRLALNTGLAEKIVVNHLSALREGNYEEVVTALDQEHDRIMGAINLINTLNPRPAARFKDERQTSYIIPDLIIKAVDGDYAIVFNDQASPVLRINPYYYRMLRQAEDEETCQFLQEKYRSALWLIKSIEQRRMTVYRITRVIIDRQRDFLEKGIKHLHPMTMQEIAGAIDMHESTVSRATTDKYIQTPRGLFEMKFFFCRGVKDISSVSIKAMIVDYIDNEPPDAPYSDSGLARELAENEGIELSRRTVAKYRNQLGIPSSTGRKNKNYSRKKEGFW